MATQERRYADATQQQESDSNLLNNPSGDLVGYIHTEFTSPRIKESLAATLQQGRYAAATNALLEFTDNSVSRRNTDGEYQTSVYVTVDLDRIRVQDVGGAGADLDGIRQFFHPGESDERGASKRGFGGKNAAWFFGEDLLIETKKQNDSRIFIIEAPGFGDRRVGFNTEFPVHKRGGQRSSIDGEKGLFMITVTRLFPNIMPTNAADLRRNLAEVYRPLLSQQTDRNEPLEPRTIVDKEGNIVEVNDKVRMRVSVKGKGEWLHPFPIPLRSPYSEDDIQIVETAEGEKLWFWAGEMDINDQRHKQVGKPGMRVYYDGRLLTIESFGFDTRDPRLTGLVGEVHVDNIHEIKEITTMNKSAGVDEYSPQWTRVKQTMQDALTPLIQKLLEKQPQIAENLPAFLPQAFKDAQQLINTCLNDMEEEDRAFKEHMKDLNLLVETFGQKPPQKPGRRERQEPEKPGIPWEDQDLQTFPPGDVDPTIKRRRKSFITRSEAYGIETPTTVSFIKYEEQADGKKGKILVMNTNNPVVQTAMMEGKFSTTRLTGEELAGHVARTYGKTVDQYLNIREDLRFRLGNYLQTTPEYQKLQKDQRGK